MQHKSLSADEWTMKQWYVYKIEYYLAIKKTETYR